MRLEFRALAKVVTPNAGDAITAVHLAIAEAESLLNRPLLSDVTDPHSGQIRPIIVVTDNGPAFTSTAFARFIDSRPELTHVRTRKKSPNTNGVREQAFGSLKYERLYHHDIADGLALAQHAHAYRHEFNTIRPHKGITFNRPADVHLDQADPTTPNFPKPETLPRPARLRCP